MTETTNTTPPLVDRLRKGESSGWITPATGIEAAARIEQLERELAEARDVLKPFGDAWRDEEYLASCHWSAFRDARTYLERNPE